MKGCTFTDRKATYKHRPNNSGTVIKLSGKQRKPYYARVSSEEQDLLTGKKKQVIIGTFETELEALNALSLYHLTNKKVLSDKEANVLDYDLYEQVMQKRNVKVPTFKEIYIDEVCNDDGIKKSFLFRYLI